MSAAELIPQQPRLADEHDQIAEWITHMRAASDFLYGDAGPARLRRLAAFYERNVRPHFRYEEEQLFPALRRIDRDPDLHDQLASFEREHAQLLDNLDQLIANLRAIAEGAMGGPEMARTTRQSRLAIDLLLLHAAQEDDVLLPLLERYELEIKQELASET